MELTDNHEEAYKWRYTLSKISYNALPNIIITTQKVNTSHFEVSLSLVPGYWFLNPISYLSQGD